MKANTPIEGLKWSLYLWRVFKVQYLTMRVIFFTISEYTFFWVTTYILTRELIN